MSEPQNSGALAVEMAGLDVIPESDRKGKPSDLFMPWFAANISVLGISWGSWVLGFGLSLTQAVIVSVVGVALSFLVCGLIAIAGKRGSAPTLVLSRAAFGFNGNRISAAISWILTVGWETFLAIMAVQATATVMGALGFTNHVVRPRGDRNRVVGPDDRGVGLEENRGLGALVERNRRIGVVIADAHHLRARDHRRKQADLVQLVDLARRLHGREQWVSLEAHNPLRALLKGAVHRVRSIRKTCDSHGSSLTREQPSVG